MQMPNWRAFIQCVDLDVGGGESASLDDLTLKDVSVKPRVGPTLGENLYLFSTAEEIQKVLKIAQTQPDILQAVRQEGADEILIDQSGAGPTGSPLPKRTDKKSGPCQCRACKAKKDKEDR